MDSILLSKALPADRFETCREWNCLSPLDGMEKPEILYLHDDGTVTAGPDRGGPVLFRGNSAEWRAFCEEHLAPLREEFSDLPGEDA